MSLQLSNWGAGHRRLRAFLDWLHGVGVRTVTVSIPHLAALIHRRYPDTTLVVSMMARVESVEQAHQWQRLGARTVVLPDNKDFRLIRALKEYTSLRLELTANLSCLSRCFQLGHHVNVVTHASQEGHPLGAYSLPLCETRCNLAKLRDPGRIMAGQWIRPEDLSIYEEIGVDNIKLLDRTSSTAQLKRVLDAYGSGRFAGNLAELIPGYRQGLADGYLRPANAGRLAGSLLRPRTYNLLRAVGFQRRNRPAAFTIDGGRLDGFLAGLMDRDCRHMRCGECGYCSDWAEVAVRFGEGERERAIAGLQRNLRDLEDGSFFFYP